MYKFLILVEASNIFSIVKFEPYSLSFLIYGITLKRT